MKHYTVNVAGNVVDEAEAKGYHAYHANGVTAVEIQAGSKKQARAIAKAHGWSVYCVFE